MSVVLIVEDMPAMREQYAYDLRRLGGHETREVSSVAAAREILLREPIDCVLLDLELPGEDGFALLETLRGQGADVAVLVYTGTGDFDRCVRAVKLGAYGFLDKAEPIGRVVHEIGRALDHGRLTREVHRLAARFEEESSLVGRSGPIRALRESIAKLAPIPSPVLVTGESGTGKELVARDLHRLSPRATEPFVPVNCAALPEQLVESELFGHERGAFTGRGPRAARRVRDGGGAERSSWTRWGSCRRPRRRSCCASSRTTSSRAWVGEKPVAVTARVVAATNRDLDAEVEAKRFRGDLLFRLNVHVLRVPPLRERAGDVALLVRHFLALTAKRFGQRPKGITEEALAVLTARDWRRNNVRELRNVVERLVLAAPGETIDGDVVRPEGGPAASPDEELFRRVGSLAELKAEAERRLVLGPRWSGTRGM